MYVKLKVIFIWTFKNTSFSVEVPQHFETKYNKMRLIVSNSQPMALNWNAGS